MSDSSEAGSAPRRHNPLIWIAVIVVGLIVFVFIGGERGQSLVAPPPEATTRLSGEVPRSTAPADGLDDTGDKASGAIERSLLVPPGMRAREYIAKLREAGPPYPLDEAFARAGEFSAEGSLADAHLVYFFAAREDHLPAIMKMAEMSDPTRFRAEEALLDHADIVQAYKWYRRAADLDYAPAPARIEGLRQWAIAEAGAGNAQARLFLLNFR